MRLSAVAFLLALGACVMLAGCTATTYRKKITSTYDPNGKITQQVVEEEILQPQRTATPFSFRHMYDKK
jgi:outer membrane biogenesis lipoprotein LolB